MFFLNGWKIYFFSPCENIRHVKLRVTRSVNIKMFYWRIDAFF